MPSPLRGAVCQGCSALSSWPAGTRGTYRQGRDGVASRHRGTRTGRHAVGRDLRRRSRRDRYTAFAGTRHQLSARLVVLVDLALQLGQRLLGGVVALGGLPEVARSAGERVEAGVHDGAMRAAGQLLDVSARAALAGGMGLRLAPLIPRTIPRIEPLDGAARRTAGQWWCPRQDSNLRSRLRRGGIRHPPVEA